MNKNTKKDNSFMVTPWEVKGNVNYDKLIKEFGTSKISDNIKKRLSKISPLIRRG